MEPGKKETFFPCRVAPVFEMLFTLVKDLEYPAGRSGVRGTVSEVIANSTTTEVPKCLQIGLGLSEEPENSTMQQEIMDSGHQIALVAWDAQRVPPGRANTATVCVLLTRAPFRSPKRREQTTGDTPSRRGAASDNASPKRAISSSGEAYNALGVAGAQS